MNEVCNPGAMGPEARAAGHKRAAHGSFLKLPSSTSHFDYDYLNLYSYNILYLHLFGIGLEPRGSVRSAPLIVVTAWLASGKLNTTINRSSYISAITVSALARRFQLGEMHSSVGCRLKLEIKNLNAVKLLPDVTLVYVKPAIQERKKHR
jgi:hypothetical protein